MHLSKVQREKLCQMTSLAFLEIRQLAEAGKLEQAFDLAAAFHFRLNEIWDDEMELAELRMEYLAGYYLKYPGQTTRNYAVLIDRAIELGNKPLPVRGGAGGSAAASSHSKK